MQFIWPVQGPVSRGFYYRDSIYIGGQHAAIDIPAATGTTIRAVADGSVANSSFDSINGHWVEVDHKEGWRSCYRHLVAPAKQERGTRVAQGQQIGQVGNTGWSLGSHLHFDLWNVHKIRGDNAIFYKRGWYAVDPTLYLGQEDDMAELEERVSTLERLLNPINFGPDEMTAGARFTEWRTAIAVLEEEVLWLKARVRTLEEVAPEDPDNLTIEEVAARLKIVVRPT